MQFLAADLVNGSGNGERSGAHVLKLLAAPLNSFVLAALSEGPVRHVELQHRARFPAQTTLRTQLRRLTESGIVIKHRRNRFPGVLEYELTAAGHDLHPAMISLERWLAGAPGGPLSLGGNAAKEIVKALTEAWSSMMLRILASGPLSLTELDGLIDSLSYPALERRLGAMRSAGLVESTHRQRRGTPYELTDWGREAVAPLTAAARWEQRHMTGETTPVSRMEVETAFLLAVRLLRLPGDLSGNCRLAAEVVNDGDRRLAGVAVEVVDGKVASCTTKLRGDAAAWALGSPTAWLNAIVDGDDGLLELGGDCNLAGELVDGLNRTLFTVSSKNGTGT